MVVLQIDMRNAPDMPELDEDASAALVHAVRHLAPARDLFFGVDAGGVLIALALLRNLARFGDQEPCGGALAVILDRQWIGYQAYDRAVAGQGRHHKAIGQGDRAKLVGLEQFGRRAHLVVSGNCRSEAGGYFYHRGNAASYSA